MRRIRESLFLPAAAVFIMALPAAIMPIGQNQHQDKLGPGRDVLEIESGGWRRRIHIEVPPAYDAGKAWPLVLIFHGAGGGGAQYLEKNGWRAKADREGFIAAAPDGLPSRPRRLPQFFLNPRLWNDGQLRPGSPRTTIDDVAFVRDLLAELGRRLSIDRRRVYAAGHSNGAGMTFRLGAELSEELTAIAAVAGHCWIEDPRPVRPLPTLYIIGTADPLVRLEGGEIDIPWGKKTNPPVARTLERWAVAIGVPAEPKIVRDAGGLRIARYGAPEGAAYLEAVYIEGQGHGWPGGQESGLPERWIGPSVETADATALIWDFFKDKARR